MKNLLQVENKVFKKYLSNDNILKIVALVSAVLLFFAINGEGGSFSAYFSSTASIQGVPLEVVYDEDQYVVTGLPDEVNVLISGPDANVTAAQRKKDTLTATLNLDISDEGSKTVDANEMTFTSIGEVNISPVIKSYDVEVQNKISKDIPINVNYVNAGDLTEGLMLDEPVLSDDLVTAVGGSQDINSIEEVKAIVDLSQLNNAEDDSVEIEAKLQAYDDQGDKVSNITLSQETVNVTQAFSHNSVTLPINYVFTNLPSNQYISSICDKDDVKSCESSDGSSYKATVEVFGDREKIDSMTGGVEYRINMANINNNNNQVEATAVLPEGVYTQNATQTVTVTMEDGVTKTLSDVPITEENLADGLEAKMVDSSDAFIDVKVTGAKSVIENIDGSNVTIVVDLDGYKSGDTATVPLQVDVADYVTAEPAKEKIEIEIIKE